MIAATPCPSVLPSRPARRRAPAGRRRSRLAAAVALLIAVLAAGVLPARAASGTLVVLNKAEDTASLIDLESGEVRATLATGTGPHEVAVSPDGRTAVATDYGSREEPGSTLTVIDIPSARATATLDLGVHRRPHGIEWLADGEHVVVTAEENHKLLKVRIADGAIVDTADTDQEISHMVAVRPDGARAFVANIGSGSVSVIDLETATLERIVPTGEGAEGIAITPDGKEVWVTNRGDDTVTVLDAGSLEILATLPSASFPIRVSITPDGRQALVSNARSGEVAVFDVATREERRRIAMDHRAEDTEGRLFGGRFGDSSVPIGILIHPGGEIAYVANANADIISIVDLERGRLEGILRAGREPDGLGFSSRRAAQGD